MDSCDTTTWILSVSCHDSGDAVVGFPGGASKKVQGRRDGSVRFRQGAQGMPASLAKTLPVTLGAVVKSIAGAPGQGGGMSVDYTGPSGDASVLAKVVVVAAPPRLVEKRITFSPPLPKHLSQAMANTPTWMEDTMKVLVRPDVRV